MNSVGSLKCVSVGAKKPIEAVFHSGWIEYDPYGNIVYTSGSYAEENPFRFSTKYHDTETGLVYYGYRYYSPDMGRWINRDPIEEDGGFSLYSFVDNNPIDFIDYLGLIPPGWWEKNGPPPGPPSRTLEGWKNALSLLGEWALGIGPDKREFGPGIIMAEQIKDSMGVDRARKYFLNKNSQKIGACCFDWADVTNFPARFGIKEFWSATINFDGTEHFVGSFDVEIFVLPCEAKAKYVITNTTSLESATYHLLPSHERNQFRPMGNIKQTIWWKEDLPCIKSDC